MLFILVVALAACTKFDDSSNPTSSPDHRSAEISVETAYHGQSGELITLANGMIVEKINGDYILGGDIILTQEQVDVFNTPQSRGTVMTEAINWWPEAKVYYDYAPNFTNQVKVEQAIAYIEANTSVRFERRGATIRNYIKFLNSTTGSSSSLGCTGGAQNINIYVSASVGTVIHEIGHSLGFFHEQMRMDAEDNLIINRNNISPAHLHNFNNYEDFGYEGLDLKDFDFNSIMMYPSYTGFEIDPTIPAMTKLDGVTTWTANRSGYSQGDIDAIQGVYGPVYAKIRYENSENYGWSTGGYTINDERFDVYVYFYSDPAYTKPVTVVSSRYIEVEKLVGTWAGINQVNTTTSTHSYDISAGTDKLFLGEGHYYLRNEWGEDRDYSSLNFEIKSDYTELPFTEYYY